MDIIFFPIIQAVIVAVGIIRIRSQRLFFGIGEAVQVGVIGGVQCCERQRRERDLRRSRLRDFIFVFQPRLSGQLWLQVGWNE